MNYYGVSANFQTKYADSTYEHPLPKPKLPKVVKSKPKPKAKKPRVLPVWYWDKFRATVTGEQFLASLKRSRT